MVDKIWKMICNFVADMVYYLRIMMNNYIYIKTDAILRLKN